MYGLPLTEEGYWELQEERSAPTATMGDAHAEWHRNTGLQYGCPQDACHPPEVDYPELGGTIKCAHCKALHPTVDDVRICADLSA